MDTSFDLDINNYSIDDLIKFFKLQMNYNTNDVDKKVNDLSREISQYKSNASNSNYKVELINFIKLARDILVMHYYDTLNKLEMEKKENSKKYFNDIGKIVNPLSVHPSLQRQSIPSNDINGYRHNKNISLYVFNTAFRESFFNTVSTNCTFILPTKLKNVISLSLSSIQLQNVMFAFSDERGTNQLYIAEETTNLSGIVILPDGNYNKLITPFLPPSSSIEEVLTKSINEQILNIINPVNYRFFVTIDANTNFTTITNTTYNFTMTPLSKNIPDPSFCDPYIFPLPNLDNKDVKLQIKPSEYIDTLAYMLGFRGFTYSGASSYTSEGTFNNSYSTYLYFVLDDHTGSQQLTTAYGLLQNSFISDNILALVPLNSETLSYVFDNNSNFIYKRREYFGPVDISRVTIKILNQSGKVVNLLNNNFSFTLQVTSVYDISKPYSSDLVEIA
jgi:hypothetical protein